MLPFSKAGAEAAPCCRAAASFSQRSADRPAWRQPLDLQLDGKRALITGARRGIGKAIARALAQDGVDVVIAARNLEPLTATALELATATGRRIMPLVVDTGDDGSVQALIKQAIYELGGIDILVNNAATGHDPVRRFPERAGDLAEPARRATEETRRLRRSRPPTDHVPVSPRSRSAAKLAMIRSRAAGSRPS
jgi:hypothetical protein